MDLKAKATAAGLDWNALLDFIRQMNWMEFFTFIKQLIDLFRGRPKARARLSHEECVCCCKAHFEAIGVLAACGCDCCDCCLAPDGH